MHITRVATSTGITQQPIIQQQRELEQVVAQALALAKPLSDATAVTLRKTTGLTVNTRLSKLENIEFNSGGALSITVYRNQRSGSASTTDLSDSAIAKALQAAVAIADFTSVDPDAGLANPALLAFEIPDLDLYHPWCPTIEIATELALKTEQTALAYHPHIVNSEGATVESHIGITVYGNSHGMLASYPSSRHSLSCCVIAEQEGSLQRDCAYTVARDHNDLRTTEWVGSAAARRALARLGARQLPTMQSAVLFASEMAPSLLGHLVAAISGDNLYRKNSFLLDQLGESILPDWLSIVEQPHRLKGLASSPFDGEGVKTTSRSIVQAGTLQSYLLNSYAARKLGMQSTGHAGGIHNWFVSHQDEDFSMLLQRMKRGLVVTELMGQGVNLVTGDYSRGVAGFWVEDGEIQYPVNEVTIAGNLKTMFKDIVAIGNDLENRSNIHSGSVLLSSMKIAGY